MLAVVGVEPDIELAAQLEQEAAAYDEAILVVELVAGQELMAVAVRVKHRHGDLGAHDAVDQGSIDVAYEVSSSIVAVSEERRCRRSAGKKRLGGDQVERAADRISTEERPLRPFDHLDAFDVGVGRKQPADRACNVDIVHVKTDARIGRKLEVTGSDAANVRGVRGAAACGSVRRVQLEIGRELGDVGQVDHAALLHGPVRERGDGDGGLLYVLLVALSGDDHLVAGTRWRRGDAAVQGARGSPSLARRVRRLDLARLRRPQAGSHRHPATGLSPVWSWRKRPSRTMQRQRNS